MISLILFVSGSMVALLALWLFIVLFPLSLLAVGGVSIILLIAIPVIKTLYGYAKGR